MPITTPINYLAVLVCAILAMALGFVWYGPLFGKKWMKLVCADEMTEEQKKASMKGMWKLYTTQFLLSLFQLGVLSWYIWNLREFSKTSVCIAFSIWFAFVMPTIAGSCMWNGDSKGDAWTKFLIQAGCQLIIFLISGLILSHWI